MTALIAQSQTAQPGGSLVGILPILLMMGALFYFMLIRPQKKRAQQQRRLLESLEIGDEIMTAGGIFGTVREMDEDTVTVEISPGTNVRMVRGAIARRLADEYDEPEEETDQTS